MDIKYQDFSKASYTVVVSDLHLCDEEPINLQYPLWKKYKTRPFFFDEEFSQFLSHLHEKTNGEQIELILAGDIFDFDSVMSLPEAPPYRVTWWEKKRGLFPQEDKSVFKIDKILSDHKVWVDALRDFINKGHRAIFIIGNHDLELHFPRVQEKIHEILNLHDEHKENIRFTEWFYISNKDTLIEHGNQYDSYCLIKDPVNPFVLKFNKIEVRVPFGNLATRYMINGMGFFNPHVDSNYIMSLREYVVFFFKYIVKAQPFLMVTWFSGAIVILIQSFFDNLLPELREPLEVEERVEDIAERSNATPRMVRELKALTVPSAASRPWLILRELWLDRAFIVLFIFFIIFEIYLFINNVYGISFFWTFIPLLLCMPFFVFYSRSIYSDVHEFKEPQEKILSMASMITGVNRIIYGHTHIVRHEIIGPVEHLNSGTWSPAFKDVTCELPIEQRTFVWIEPGELGTRRAKLIRYKSGVEGELFTGKTRKLSRGQLAPRK